MAIILNKDARQYNVREKTKDGLAVLRLKPGLNIVEDDHLELFKGCKFMKELAEKGKIEMDTKPDEELGKEHESQAKVVQDPAKQTKS